METELLMGWPAGWTIPAEWRGTPHGAPLADHTPRLAGAAHYRRATRAQSAEADETWVPDDEAHTISGFDQGDARAVELVVSDVAGSDTAATLRGFGHGWQGQQNSTHAIFAPEAATVLSSHHGHRTTDLKTTLVGSLDQQRGGPDDNAAQAGHLVPDGLDSARYLPDGLDSARYRCCGNGVVAPVAEWLGARIIAAIAQEGAA